MILIFLTSLFIPANAQDANATLFGTWRVAQFNYSCDADASGKRMVGHRPIDFNTVSFTNWSGVFKAWTTDWAVMTGTYHANGSFVATGKVGVNQNDTSATACALTSRISGWFNESDASWEAILQLDYSTLCWGCLLDEDGCPSERSVPLRSSQYLAPPKPNDQPVTLNPPDYLQALMVEWPVSARGKCGLFNLAVSAVKFANVNFSSILLTANTSLGRLPLRGRYQVSNDSFSASASFPFTLGGQCNAIVQVTGQVQLAENSSCAEDHNQSLIWNANVTLRVLGGCAQCTQLQFPLTPFDCSNNSTNETNSSLGLAEEMNSTLAPSTSRPSPAPTGFDILAGVDSRNMDVGDGDSFIRDVPLWGACLIVAAIFLCCVAFCVCVFLFPRYHASKSKPAPTPKDAEGAEHEHLVTS